MFHSAVEVFGDFVLKINASSFFFFFTDISYTTHYLFSAAPESICFTLAHPLNC